MTEFKLPELGENIHQGDLVRLMISPGASITEGQPVMELETDKAVVEVPSSVSGTVKEVHVKEGEKIKVGQVIFTVENGAGAKVVEARPPKAEKPATAPAATAQRAPSAPAPPAAAPSQAAPASGPAEFKLPELGENIHQGDLVRLMIEPGAKVTEGQPVMELETDKAVVEVPSTISGVVKNVLVKAGEKVKVGQVIFTLEGAATAPERQQHEPVEHVSGQHGARLAFQALIRAEGKTEEQALPPDQPQAAPPAFSMPAHLERTRGHEHREPVPAAPHTRRLARELGVEIHEVKGTGPGGRISEDDVKAHAKQMLLSATAAAQAPRESHFAAAALPDFSRWGQVERVSMRGVRRKTAEHLWQAWTSIPHVTQQDKADITELEQLRARFAPKAQEAGGKMTVTAIALKVCASALKIFPQFNASLDMAKEEIVYKQYIHIGVAVDTDRGLLVPVIRDVDKKNIVELAAELTQFSKKARDKKLTPQDMEGGTFTITNLGGIGGTGFSPIVNFPEVAILGLSRSSMEPVWSNGKFEPRLVLPLSLSYDHRLIDGADAARFLRWIAEAFEQPFLLSVQG
ncbi:MAG TPA: dihydrolipoyllysine-residue acetyltransferase [Terriglobales bacterium]|nr:dihydrolipoyllysine-residue acetyltransferase [Terriglobales bacterium]